jgi:hypothetical protein
MNSHPMGRPWTRQTRHDVVVDESQGNHCRCFFSSEENNSGMVIDDSLGVIDEAQMLLKNLRVMSQKTPLIDPVDCART